jgi:hypothetical protein
MQIILDKEVDFLSVNIIPELIKDGLPIGTIQPYSTALYGENIEAGYLLCDGRSCEGTEYSRLTGQTFTPDLSGQFLIGASSARPLQTFQNDSTGLPIQPFTATVSANGTHTHATTASVAGSHTHEYTSFDAAVVGVDAFFDDQSPLAGQMVNDTTLMAGFHNHSITSSSSGLHTHAVQLNGWSDETAPSSFSVYYYIKVNE